jgi:hypothetical protein
MHSFIDLKFVTCDIFAITITDHCSHCCLLLWSLVTTLDITNEHILNLRHQLLRNNCLNPIL